MIQSLFPNADIIIERFHLAQLINRAMNQTRITIINQLSRLPIDQKILTNEALSASVLKETTLSYTDYHYYTMFRQHTEAEILQAMLDFH